MTEIFFGMANRKEICQIFKDYLYFSYFVMAAPLQKGLCWENIQGEIQLIPESVYNSYSPGCKNWEAVGKHKSKN
jgi:hypothetical protein